MTNISASLVKELRERTGMGMMDCKQALLKVEGNIELAIEELRKSSGIKAEKKADRSAADGVIQAIQNNNIAFMAEINCETDFVAKDDSFINFSEEVIKALSIELFLLLIIDLQNRNLLKSKLLHQDLLLLLEHHEIGDPRKESKSISQIQVIGL